jgi:hypothetical protein
MTPLTSCFCLLTLFLKGLSSEATESMIDPIIPTTFSIANNQASTIKRGAQETLINKK